MNNIDFEPHFHGRSPALKWLGIIGVWVVLGIIYAGPIYFEVRAEGMDYSAWKIFGWGILTWLSWAPLTPLILYLARNYSLIGDSWKRSLIVHIPDFVVYSILHSSSA